MGDLPKGVFVLSSGKSFSVIVFQFKSYSDDIFWLLSRPLFEMKLIEKATITIRIKKSFMLFILKVTRPLREINVFDVYQTSARILQAGVFISSKDFVATHSQLFDRNIGWSKWVFVIAVASKRQTPKRSLISSTLFRKLRIFSKAMLNLFEPRLRANNPALLVQYTLPTRIHLYIVWKKQDLPCCHRVRMIQDCLSSKYPWTKWRPSK